MTHQGINAATVTIRLSKAAQEALGQASITAPQNAFADVVHAAKLR